MARTLRWVTLPLILLLLIAAVLPTSGCTGEVEWLWFLISGIWCGMEVYIDDEYLGTTDFIAEWASCVFLGRATSGEHVFKFVIPGEALAAAAHDLTGEEVKPAIPGVHCVASITLMEGGHYELPVRLAPISALSPMVESAQKELRIVIEASREPFLPPV